MGLLQTVQFLVLPLRDDCDAAGPLVQEQQILWPKKREIN